MEAKAGRSHAKSAIVAGVVVFVAAMGSGCECSPRLPRGSERASADLPRGSERASAELESAGSSSEAVRVDVAPIMAAAAPLEFEVVDGSWVLREGADTASIRPPFGAPVERVTRVHLDVAARDPALFVETAEGVALVDLSPDEPREARLLFRGSVPLSTTGREAPVDVRYRLADLEGTGRRQLHEVTETSLGYHLITASRVLRWDGRRYGGDELHIESPSSRVPIRPSMAALPAAVVEEIARAIPGANRRSLRDLRGLGGTVIDFERPVGDRTRRTNSAPPSADDVLSVGETLVGWAFSRPLPREGRPHMYVVVVAPAGSERRVATFDVGEVTPASPDAMPDCSPLFQGWVGVEDHEWSIGRPERILTVRFHPDAENAKHLELRWDGEELTYSRERPLGFPCEADAYPDLYTQVRLRVIRAQALRPILLEAVSRREAGAPEEATELVREALSRAHDLRLARALIDEAPFAALWNLPELRRPPAEPGGPAFAALTPLHPVVGGIRGCCSIRRRPEPPDLHPAWSDGLSRPGSSVAKVERAAIDPPSLEALARPMIHRKGVSYEVLRCNADAIRNAPARADLPGDALVPIAEPFWWRPISGRRFLVLAVEIDVEGTSLQIAHHYREQYEHDHHRVGLIVYEADASDRLDASWVYVWSGPCIDSAVQAVRTADGLHVGMIEWCAGGERNAGEVCLLRARGEGNLDVRCGPPERLEALSTGATRSPG